MSAKEESAPSKPTSAHSGEEKTRVGSLKNLAGSRMGSRAGSLKGSLRNLANKPPVPNADPNNNAEAPINAAIVYENTFKMKPDKKLPTEAIKRLVDATLSKHLTKVKYDFEAIPELTKTIANDVLGQIKTMEIERYKYIVDVQIGEFKGQGIKIGSRALWDTTTDTFASGSFRNATLFAVAMVFGTFYE